MTGEKCSLTCNVKDPRTGKVKVSALWEELSKIFKGDRRAAVAHYFLTKNSNFLRENSDVLEFDADGEVTITSLKKALEKDGEYSNLSNARVLEHLNREIKAGKYEYSEALDNVLKFNKQNQFNKDFLATLKREEDGKYSISVVERSPETEYRLAEHVQNKILTDAIKMVLNQMKDPATGKGLSIEFIDNPSYAVHYSTANAHLDADGFLAIASILDGETSSEDTAEAAGHFIVAAMQNNPIIQRLIDNLTPDVQTAIFKDEKSDMLRDDFIVSESSATEAAGILIGRQLLDSIEKGQKTKAATIGTAIPKAIKWLLKKAGNIAKRIFRMYKPNMVHEMVEKAWAAAFTAAQGFISNPERADVESALNAQETYVGNSVTKRLSNEVRRNVRAYYDTLGSLKSIVSGLRSTIKRAESPTNRDILNKLRELTKGIQANYSPQMSLEAFAENASIEGMVVALTGITQILDTDIRSLLDQIQPSDRAQSYASISTNARNMRTANTAIKNIAVLYDIISKKLDTLKANDIVQFPDADGNQIVTSLREATKRLGDVLIGSNELYTDTKGIDQQVSGLQRVMELKRRQIFIDALRNFYGDNFIEMNAGKVWQQRGWRIKLINSKNRRVEIQDLVDSLDEDISWFDRYMSAAADCGDFVTAVGDKVTKQANMQADRMALKFWDTIEELRLQMQDAFGDTDCRRFFELVTDDEGHTVKSGNLVSQVNYGEWEKARHEKALQLKKDFNEYIANMRKTAYENNKNVPGYVFSLTDQQRAFFWHNFIAPQWKKWHEENSEEDTSSGKKRMVPNHIKYKSTQWEELFGTNDPTLSAEEKAARIKRQKWYNSFMELKDMMDILLPKNSTVRWRAPQMTGRFSHRFRNLRAKTGKNASAFGHAIRRQAQDFWAIRPDEAYLFGSNNEFNRIEEDPLENPMYFEKEKINRLPLYGINKLDNMEDLSTDLFGTMMEYGSMASTYMAMEQVVDIFELGRDVLKQREVGGVKEANRSESRAYSRYVKFLEKSVYAINVSPPSWDRKGMWRKLANHLSSLGGRILLWGNVHGGIVNTGTGTFEILKEAWAGENFTTKELEEAHKMYFSGLMFNIFGDKYGGGFWDSVGQNLANVQRPDDKNSLWIRHWNILSENRSFLRNQKFDTKAMSLLDNRLWEWFGHTMMLPYSSGDHYMQTIPYYAIGIKTKVYDHDGNAMRLIDAYDVVDGKEVFAVDDTAQSGESIGQTPKKLQLKKEIFRSAADIDKYDMAMSMLNRIEDYFSSHPNLNAYIPLQPLNFSDEELKYLEDEGFVNPTNTKQLSTLKTALQLKAQELLFNEDDESAFMDKCRNICNRLHGIYNSEDRVTFQQNFYGNLVMAMRGYALGMVNRRYARSKFNVPQRKVIEGNYNTAFKVMMSAFYDIDNMDNWNAVGEALLLTAFPPLLFNKGYGNRLKADMIKAGFTEHQYYNMRRTGADFLVIYALMLMKFLSSPGKHFGLNDDEDEEKNKGNDTSDNLLAGLIYYFSMRLDREQEAFNTPSGMKNEATSLLDYVPIGFSGANNIWNIAKLFIATQADKLDGEKSLDNSELYYQQTKEGKYEAGEAKWWAMFKRQIPYYRSWYVFTHPYDAASGFQYGRRVRNK